MRLQIVRVIAVALAGFLVFGCGDDGGGSGGDGAGGAGAGGTSGGGGSNSGPANEINGSVEGGNQAGPVNGSSEESAPELNYGAVADQLLTVSLASPERGLMVFTVNTATGEAPGTFPVGDDLSGPATLTWTNAATAAILEGTGGSIQLQACPNEQGARVTGVFNDIELTNLATEQPDGVLSGTFAVTIVQTDGSAACAVEPEPEPQPGGGNGPSPGPMCPNDTCDGACCPLMPAFSACIIECQAGIDPTNPASFQGVITCAADCEQPLRDDPECGPAFDALDTCGQEDMCEGSLDDNPCVAANCCDEYRAAL
jgi:hypothetical protein